MASGDWQAGTELEEVSVCQMRSASQFTMEAMVGDRTIRAVVDTAAQVTIISDRVYQSLSRKPPKIREVKLLTAGRELGMKGFVVGPVKLRLGNRWYTEEVYVAPIQEDMLLGFDLLRDRGSAILGMDNGILQFYG